MKMIITGTSGFIGAHLFQAARESYGDDVTAFSSRPADGNHIIYRDIPGFGLTSIDLSFVEEAEVLIHAGAFTPKCGADANQIAGCNRNIIFTDELLALPWKKLNKIIFLSTIDVYTNIDSAISENTATTPSTLYGLSKFYCERILELFAANRNITCQILRIGHVYGPGEEKYAKVIPNSIHRIISDKDVELWGEGKELRSFIYIKDVVTAILNAVKSGELPEIINVVSGNAISILDLINILVAIGGRGTGIARRALQGQARDVVFDNAKLKNYLLPEETNFIDGLQAEFNHIQNLSNLK